MTFEQVTGAISELERQKATLAAGLAATASELAEAEARIGDEFLSGNENFIETLSPLRNRFDSLNHAVVVINKRIETAGVDLMRAEIAAKRQDAALKRAQLEKLEAQTAPLLVRLGELEGVKYGPGILSCEPSPNALLESPAYLGLAERPFNVAFSGSVCLCPRSRALRAEIEQLEKEAIRIEIKLPRPAAPVVVQEAA
jgi:hypothetical protein